MHANVFIGGGLISRLLSRKKAKNRIYRRKERKKTENSLGEWILFAHFWGKLISLFLTKIKVSLDTLFLSRQMRGYQRKELNWLWILPENLESLPGRSQVRLSRGYGWWRLVIRPESRLSQDCTIYLITILLADFNVLCHFILNF